MSSFSSFTAFQDWLKTSWFPANQNAVQLDGSASKRTNPKVEITFDLVEIRNLSAPISLHGDTTIEALKKLAAASITDFIIVPPQPSKDYWRIHFKSTHNYSNDQDADGLYAYLK